MTDSSTAQNKARGGFFRRRFRLGRRKRSSPTPNNDPVDTPCVKNHLADISIETKDTSCSVEILTGTPPRTIFQETSPERQQEWMTRVQKMIQPQPNTVEPNHLQAVTPPVQTTDGETTPCLEKTSSILLPRAPITVADTGKRLYFFDEQTASSSAYKPDSGVASTTLSTSSSSYGATLIADDVSVSSMELLFMTCYSMCAEECVSSPAPSGRNLNGMTIPATEPIREETEGTTLKVVPVDIVGVAVQDTVDL